jgi:membrane-bound lytic murein transglycosylase D
MRSWKILSVGLVLLQTMAFANNDTLTVSEKNEAVMINDAVFYFDSLNRARNTELGMLFFNNAITENADTSFEISDEDLLSRLNALNNNTPLEISYNKRIRSFIHLYAFRQRDLTERVLGLSKFYYPMIEEALDKYDIPLEIKHLAVVESALNPGARSRAGAVGLWQFMYWTGKANGLKVSSYVDEREDPLKATEAACKYLLELHGMYDDWNLALAAYNSGPGNVNKAIRRSGGKRDYWSIWPFLPRETRSYVPAFIAVNYIMNYASEHGLVAQEPMYNFWNTDTVIVRGPLELANVANLLSLEPTIVEALNPSFRKNLIPADGKSYALVLPATSILSFIDIHDTTLYANAEEVNVVEEKEERIFHYVRSGEVLGVIARRHNCSVRQIMEWNNLRSTNIRAGQRLVVMSKTTSKPTLVQAKKDQPSEQKKESVTEPDKSTFIYHTVKPGDTLWDIANKYDGVSVSQLKQLNGSVNVHRLKLGQKLKIKVAG